MDRLKTNLQEKRPRFAHKKVLLDDDNAQLIPLQWWIYDLFDIIPTLQN